MSELKAEKGVIAVCSAGCIGIITENEKKAIYGDEDSQRSYVGVHISKTLAGTGWSSRAPKLICNADDIPKLVERAKRSITAQSIANALNEMFAVCPTQLHAALFNYTPATQEMIDHPKILCGAVHSLGGQDAIFSGLGMINTLLHGTGELVAATFKDGKMVGFQVLQDAGMTEGVLSVNT